MKNYLKFKDLGEDYYTTIKPRVFDNSYLIHLNNDLKKYLDIDLSDKDILNICAGKKKFFDVEPLSSVYAGHQFGYFVPQLGDGRSCLIGEANGWEISLKGSGMTPYSRNGDGLAVLRSSIREYLCSIAMVGLNIPTTQALAIIGSDTDVIRESIEKAAVVARVAKTHIRFGHFEFFANKADYNSVKKLADFVIEHYYEQLNGSDDKYLLFFRNVVKLTAIMIARWQAQGFAHGVMNSDNMSITGLTIDYGPFGFMEKYDYSFVPNSSDYESRYCFQRQPNVALWNLEKLAQSLTSLIDEKRIKQVLAEYQVFLIKEYTELMRDKFGLSEIVDGDNDLIEDFLQLLYLYKKDYHISIRSLAKKDNTLGDEFNDWFDRYGKRLANNAYKYDERKVIMNAINPKFILRNYLAEIAIRQAEDLNQYNEVNVLFELLKNPFNDNEKFAAYSKEAPDWAKNLTLSCSS